VNLAQLLSACINLPVRSGISRRDAEVLRLDSDMSKIE
jgi:hypothetical protein